MSPAERSLLALVEDDDLKTSLKLIRQAVVKIWSPEARIIRGYTDHGEQHCVRLSGYARDLLAANGGRQFSSLEVYLLLAGIYLHDIGMQCDVIRLAEVKQLAEKIGADFGGIVFTAATANDYSYEEQKAIRRNHNYLSVAWLRYARQSSNGSLSLAAKTIPEQHLQDLVSVCLHHTKLPIGGCATSAVLGGPERIQLIAATLRFADELDVAASRVTIETVKNFQLDTENSVYWWLHHATTVTINPSNVVTLKVSLNPVDYAQLKDQVRAAFITAFQNKNRPVLEVLRQNGMEIVINADSDVVEYEYSEPLPPEIVRILTVEARSDDPATALANEVKTWLQAMRYEVSIVRRRDDRSSDMEATLEQGTVKQNVIVRCISDETNASDVIELNDCLDKRSPQGWLISQSRVSPNALSKAAEEDYQGFLKVLTFSEFLSREVWAPYISSLTALVEREQLPGGRSLYVDIGCYKAEIADDLTEKTHDYYASLDTYIDNWLTERGKKHISLLGEFGTGKTWFCRHFAYRQLHRYLKNPLHERFPLLITLRRFAKAMTAEQLINDALLTQYNLPFFGNPFEIFQQMNRNGKLLLILDGFDEMARQVTQQTIIDNFWELASLVGDDSKIILTSRTEYFRQSKESESIFAGLEYGRRTLKLAAPKFEVVQLEGLTDEQISQIIKVRLEGVKGPAEAQAIAEEILATEALAEMARKPLLVELLLAALDEVSPTVLQNPAQVYLYATNKLLLRNIETQRTFTTTADKLYFLCELAWEMIRSGELRIHYKDIPKRIASYFGPRIRDRHELDHWDFDLRNQTLLHRDAAGYYEFAHKSLAEYFVALKFAAEIGCLAPVIKETYVELNDKACQFPIQEIDDWDKLTLSFGQQSLLTGSMAAIYRLLQEMVSLYPGAQEKLWKLIYKTRVVRGTEATVIGGNAFNLLRHLRQDFDDKDFSRVRLRHANLSGLTFVKANFSEVILSSCIITHGDFTDVDFSLANITLLPMGSAESTPTKFVGVRVSNAKIPVSNLEKFKAGGAILSRVQDDMLSDYLKSRRLAQARERLAQQKAEPAEGP